MKLHTMPIKNARRHSFAILVYTLLLIRYLFLHISYTALCFYRFIVPPMFYASFLCKKHRHALSMYFIFTRFSVSDTSLKYLKDCLKVSVAKTPPGISARCNSNIALIFLPYARCIGKHAPNSLSLSLPLFLVHLIRTERA